MTVTVHRTALGVFLLGPYADRPTEDPSYEQAIYVPDDDLGPWAVQLGGTWREAAGGGGGGGPGTLTATVERATYGCAAADYADDSSTAISWSKSSGTALLDLSTPTTPTVLVDGDYRFLAGAYPTTPAAGQFGLFTLVPQPDDPDAAGISAIGSLDNTFGVAGNTAAYVTAGGAVNTAFGHTDTGHTINATAFMFVERLVYSIT